LAIYGPECVKTQKNHQSIYRVPSESHKSTHQFILLVAWKMVVISKVVAAKSFYVGIELLCLRAKKGF